ncbi:SHOCT domain-containing protein [Chitinimonas naiadis]
MQHVFTSRLGALFFGLVVATSAFATETVKPWSETDDYVRLDPVNANNQHPVTFSAEQLQNLLAHFYKKETNKDPAPYFTEDEVKRLSTWLLPVFNKSKPGDDILFGTSYRPGGFVLIPRVLNAGRLFVENGRLNLLVGMCGDQLDLAYQRSYTANRPLNHGSRIKPVNDMNCELLAGNGAERVNNRADWLSLDIATGLATRPSGDVTFQPIGPKTTFQAAPVAPTTTFKPAAPAAGKPASPAAAAPQVAPAPVQQVLPAAPLSKAEERLQLLKRLKDNGLITDAEYEQKRISILKDL